MESYANMHVKKNYVKDKINFLNSFCSNLIKLRACLLVLNMDVCVTLYMFYATENMGSVQLSEKRYSIESLATIPSIYIYKYWLVYFTRAESVKMLYPH